MGFYILVFIASMLVDVVPFVGPPAWSVMVLLQIKYHLDIWWVLIAGVLGSTLGRYIYSLYIPLLSDRIISEQKNEDIRFVGERLGHSGWKVQIFVFLYTLMPLPSTPLFTAAGIARIPALHLLPAFFVGKFISDMVMVVSGDYAARNAASLSSGLFSWQSIAGSLAGIVVILFFLFTDWRYLLTEKKFRIRFNIWRK
jgi:membrane protein YqaA with SNARE-associated domain